MIRLLWLGVLATLLSQVTIVYGQRWSPFKNLRYDEQYLLLSDDTLHHTLYAKLKHSTRKRAMFSFGGEVRSQYFKIENEDWGETKESTDGYLLSRYLLHTNINIRNRIRVFSQLQGGREDWKNSVDPVDENYTDIHQVFIDYKLLNKKNLSTTLRVGRQELLYGSQRLVSVREGPNYRQSFDAIKLMAIKDAWSVDAFYGHHVNVKEGYFNDAWSRSIRFWGLYTSNKSFRLANLDFYYFGYHKLNAQYQLQSGTEKRHSLGVRVWKISDHFSIDAECVVQIGKIRNYLIRAATAAVSTNYIFHDLIFKPEVGIKAEIITGDESSTDAITNTFNAMFPRGGYFGLAALFGPANLTDIHPSLTFSILKPLALTFEYDAFWRYSLSDGLYSYSGSLLYAGDAGKSRYIGDQFSGELAFTPNIFLKCTLELKWFNSGPFLKEAGPGKDILFILFQTQLKF